MFTCRLSATKIIWLNKFLSALRTIMSREIFDLCSIMMLAKVFRPCFFNLLWNLSCWSSSSLALDSWCATFPTVWALSRSLQTSEGATVSHSVHVIRVHCVPKNLHLFIFWITLSKINRFYCVKSWENLISIACTLAHLTLYCSHFTLGDPKKSFFKSIIHAYLIIYVISEENKLLLPYPPHLKNITKLPCKMQNFFIWLKMMLRSATLCWNSVNVATRRFQNSSISRIGTR